MRKSNQQSIGEIVEQFLKENRLDKKLKRAHVIGCWEELMGKVVANHTRNLYFSDQVLFVELDSPALRNELVFRKAEVVKKINADAGEELIKEVVFK